MPSTLRVNIAGKDANSYVLTSIDDVLDTSYGRQLTFDMAADTPLTMLWPTTGEILVYMRFPKKINTYTVRLAADPAYPGFIVTIPVGDGMHPFLVGRPSTGQVIVQSSVAITAQAYFL